ncbi:hypothetical protein [Kitasatospora camelliae]|uniref:Uncharacterized protein n=1 Tax=Kitasatospora camelliae TaxID=3156397 RepID=A0AAU8JV25_9ACTN
MPYVRRPVLLRAAAAALALGVAVGVEAAVEQALARRGAERAERDAYVCAQAAARTSEGREPGGGPWLGRLLPPARCELAARSAATPGKSDN